MTLTINTNVASIIAERNLNNATNSLNRSLERLSTGYKINHASDNAAGYSISDMWTTQIGSLDVAADNASTGADLLQTAEQTYSLLTNHLQRIRDLTEQASNGTYGSASLKAIQSEIYARLQEIDRISANAEFNGIKLMSYIDSATSGNTGLTDRGIDLQVGLYSQEDSVINLDISLFRSAAVSGLFANKTATVTKTDGTVENAAIATVLGKAGATTDLKEIEGLKTFAAACSGLYNEGNDNYVLLSSKPNADYTASAMLGFVDKAIDEIARRITKIGSAQNRVASALSGIDVQSQNLVSSLSTLRDTDVANESSKYIQSQILQQASATLLATANQTPTIALNLL